MNNEFHLFYPLNPIEIVLGTKLRSQKHGSKWHVVEISETMTYIQFWIHYN